MLSANRIHAKAGVAALIMCLVALLTWSNRPGSAAETDPLVRSRFSFERFPLAYGEASTKTVRRVHRSLVRMESWISAVGAAAAINDLDGDGLANDVCLVDTRSDTVTIAPAPGTPLRYKPFVLKPSGEADPATAPMGCLPGDFDQDGNMDVLVYYWGRTPIIFHYRPDQKGKPLSAEAYIAEPLTTSRQRWYSNAALLADFDGDGHPDILIANYFPDGSEILNTNDTHEQYLHASMSHAFNGGQKHFFLAQGGANEATTGYREVTPEFLNPDRSAMTKGDASAILRGWTLAAGAADLNHDLLPELYLANDFGPDRLLENASVPGRLVFRLIDGHRDFFTPKSKVLGHDSFKGMGVDFSDLNADGKLDILVSNITEEFGLEESNFTFINRCSATERSELSTCFTDQSQPLGLSQSGWSWDIKTADFDNSGSLEVVQATGFLKAPAGSNGINRWPQLHETAMGNDVLLRFPSAWHDYHAADDVSGQDRNRFYVRQASGKFVDISEQIGIRHDAVGRGVAIADVDGDGRPDFAVANQWGDSDYYHNVSPATGAALTLRLLLPLDHSGVHAEAQFATTPLGARSDAVYAMTAEALVALPDGRRLLQQVSGGNGHSGKNSFDLHFGLGSLPKKETIPVVLRWRDRRGVPRSRHLSLNPGQYNVLLGA